MILLLKRVCRRLLYVSSVTSKCVFYLVLTCRKPHDLKETLRNLVIMSKELNSLYACCFESVPLNVISINTCFPSGDTHCLTLHSSLQSSVLLGLSVHSYNPSHCQGGGRRVNQSGQPRRDPVSKSNSKSVAEGSF